MTICNKELYGSSWEISMDVEPRTLVDLIVCGLSDNDLTDSHQRFNAAVENLYLALEEARRAQDSFPSWEWMSDKERAASNRVYFSCRAAVNAVKDACHDIFAARDNTDKMAAVLRQSTERINAATKEVEKSFVH